MLAASIKVTLLVFELPDIRKLFLSLCVIAIIEFTCVKLIGSRNTYFLYTTRLSALVLMRYNEPSDMVVCSCWLTCWVK
jgi:hypothetical protein